MSAEAPWLDAPVVDDPEPWKSAPIVEDPEQPWLSAPVVEEAPSETTPAGHPDRFTERGTTDAQQTAIANRSPELQAKMEQREKDAARGQAAAETLGLKGTMLDQTPESLTALTSGMRPEAEIERIAASGFNAGSINLDAFILPPLKEGETRTQESVSAEQEGVEKKPILQLPTFADPNVPAGVVNAGLNIVSGLTSTENLALMTAIGKAPGMIKQAASLGFSTVMIKDAVEQFINAPEGETEGQKAERVTTGVLSLLLGGAAGAHGTGVRPATGGLKPGETRPLSLSQERVDARIAGRDSPGTHPVGTRIASDWGTYEKRPDGEWREVDENGYVLSDTRIIGTPKGEVISAPSAATGTAGTAGLTAETSPRPAMDATAPKGSTPEGVPAKEPLPPSGEPVPSPGSLAEGSKATEWKQAALPEELRTSKELEDALAPAKPEYERAPMRELDTSKGAAIGGGGGRPVVKPVGATPKGDTNFIRVESAPKRLFSGLLTEGTADVMAKSKNKVGQTLAKQIRKHVDLEQEITGQLTAELDRGTKGMAPATVKKAIAELELYLAAKENKRPLPQISKEAQSLLTAWENIAERTGLMSEAHNVQVFDPTTGSYRPMHRMGRSYVPRVFKPEVQRVLSDPRRDPGLFNDLAQALAAHRGVTVEAAAAELRGVAGRFQASDFMGNLEMARTGQLPETFYDYNLGNIASRYVSNFGERMSQIIAYGQRLGPREAPLRENLWDVAMKEAEDGYTQQWIRGAEDQAVNLKDAGGFGKTARQAQTLASGLLLSSPTTTVMRNMLSGTGATTELLGVRRSASKLIEAATSAQAKLDAREMGVVRENLGDFLHADQLGQTKGDELIRGIVNKTLKYSGYTGSEGFVRTHAAVTASQFAKDGVAAISKDPKSSQAKEALGLFKRMGADAEKIVAEGADWKTGAETRKFVRTVVRDSQGGYRFDQVPQWLNSPVGRFFFQYLRWGQQRSRNIWKNGIQPLIGEEVQWHGKTMARRDAGPIIKMGLGAIVLGETYALMSQGFFGRDRKDASIQEITEALTEDQKDAAVMMADRMINDILMSGSLGIWSQPVDALKSLKDQSRLKNPAEPPSMASPKAVAKLAKNALDQEGRVTNRDLLEFVGGVAPGVKQLTDLGRNVFDEPLYEAENDVRTLRTAGARWAQANKIDVPKRSVTNVSKSVNSPEYEAIHEALLTGNADRAKFLAGKFVSEKRGEMANVKQSVKSRQPFRVGPFTNTDYKGQFMTWASSHLPKKDFEQAKRVQDRYEAAAKSAGLW